MTEKELEEITRRYNLLRKVDESIRVIRTGFEWMLEKLKSIEEEFGVVPVRPPLAEAPEVPEAKPEELTVKEAEITQLPWQYYDEAKTRGWLLSDPEKPVSQYTLTPEQKDVVRRAVEKIRKEQPKTKAIFVGSWRLALAGDKEQFLRLTKVRR